MRIRIILALLLTLLATRATAAPYPPDLSLRHYLSHTYFVPRQGGMSNPPIVFQNQGIPLGVSFTVNCSTGMTCSFVNGAMTLTATGGGGGFPRLDQVLDPTADKAFAMGAHNLAFNYTGGTAGDAAFEVKGSNTALAWFGSNSSQLPATVPVGTVVIASLNPASTSGTVLGIAAEQSVSTASGISGFTSRGTTTHTSGTVAQIDAGDFIFSANGVGGTTSSLNGLYISGGSHAGTIVTDARAIWIDVPNYAANTVTNGYGFYVDDQVGAANNWAWKSGLGKVEFGDSASAVSYLTATNCSSAASPAVCGSAAAGSVAVPTGITPTLVVNTTAVTANSQILFTPDEGLGTRLSVTCNSTIAQVAIEPIVTARVAGTSFTIQYNTTVTTNPICLSYLIIN